MPRPMYRTNSWRKVRVRTPGGRVVIHYEKRHPSKAKCPICGRVLNGVPTLRPHQLSKLAKTEKRPERLYGGVICPKCLAKSLREAARTGLAT